MENKVQRRMESEIGPLFLVASSHALYGVFWKDQKLPTENTVDGTTETAMLDNAEAQITEYLNGKRTSFDLPLILEGTEFQKRVWRELQKIPYGQTKSYKEIAIALKDPNACRAVGTANGKNPISLIVPCHRVINESGKLGGYAGGLPIKAKLLDLERKP